jgi:thioredoxin 1
MRALKLPLLVLLAFYGLFAAAPASAQEWVTYTPAAFAEAQSAGKPVVVHVHAAWCPTCRAQLPTLDELKAELAPSGVRFIRVDFDKDKEFLRTHRVSSQSTILTFRGDKETARSVAQTDRARLRSLVLGGAQS